MREGGTGAVAAAMLSHLSEVRTRLLPFLPSFLGRLRRRDPTLPQNSKSGFEQVSPDTILNKHMAHLKESKLSSEHSLTEQDR